VCLLLCPSTLPLPRRAEANVASSTQARRPRKVQRSLAGELELAKIENASDEVFVNSVRWPITDSERAASHSHALNFQTARPESAVASIQTTTALALSKIGRPSTLSD